MPCARDIFAGEERKGTSTTHLWSVYGGGLQLTERTDIFFSGLQRGVGKQKVV
jgi:hypothetical protein